MSLTDTSAELSTLKKALQSVIRDMDTLSAGMVKAQMESDAAIELKEKLKRKCVPLQNNKQDLEERIARLEGMIAVQRRAAAVDAENLAAKQDEANAMNSAVEWEKKNGFPRMTNAW